MHILENPTLEKASVGGHVSRVGSILTRLCALRFSIPLVPLHNETEGLASVIELSVNSKQVTPFLLFVYKDQQKCILYDENSCSMT